MHSGKEMCMHGKRLDVYTLTLLMVGLGVFIGHDCFPSCLCAFISDVHRKHAFATFIISKDICKIAHSIIFLMCIK